MFHSHFLYILDIGVIFQEASSEESSERRDFKRKKRLIVTLSTTKIDVGQDP